MPGTLVVSGDVPLFYRKWNITIGANGGNQKWNIIFYPININASFFQRPLYSDVKIGKKSFKSLFIHIN